MYAFRKTWLLPLSVAMASCVWALLVWSLGLGGELFLMPGFIALNVGEILGLLESPVVGPHTLGELAVKSGIWGGLHAWAIAVFFWVIALPCFLWLARVSYRWGKLRLTTGSS